MASTEHHSSPAAPDRPLFTDLGSFRLGKSHPFELDAAGLLADAVVEFDRLSTECQTAISALGSGYSQPTFDAFYRHEPVLRAIGDLRLRLLGLVEPHAGEFTPAQQRVLWHLDQALAERSLNNCTSLEGLENLLRHGSRKAETMGIWTVVATQGPTAAPSEAESEMPYGFDPSQLPHRPATLKTFFSDAEQLRLMADLVKQIRVRG